MKLKGQPEDERQSRRLVYVRWLDACFQEGDCAEQDMVPGIEVETVGFLAHQDEGAVSVAMQWCETDCTWQRVLHIPRALVREMRQQATLPDEGGSSVSRVRELEDTLRRLLDASQNASYDRHAEDLEFRGVRAAAQAILGGS